MPSVPVPVVSFRELAPPRSLRRHVWSLWVHRVGPHDEPYYHREVPSGGAHLVHRSDGTSELIGPQTGPTERMIPPGTTVIGARLRPGVDLTRLGAPAEDLVDVAIGRDSMTRQGARLLDGVDAHRSGRGALRELIRQLDTVFDGYDRPITGEAVDELVRRSGSPFVPVHSSLLSERQLRRRFRADVGMSPRTLHRLLRFQRVLHTVQTQPPRLATLASDTGYADQAHLTRECVRLAGVPLGRLVSDTARFCGAHHDHAPAFTPLGLTDV